MQTAVRISRAFTGFSSYEELADSGSGVSRAGLQDILASQLARVANSCKSFHELADLSIRLAERAYTLRDLDALQEASLVLMNLPVRGVREIGLYYRALAFKRIGSTEEARSLFEYVSFSAPPAYRARALQSLGTLNRDEGDPATALRFNLEALRATSIEKTGDLLTRLIAHAEISAIKSLDGDHQEALRILQELSPMATVVGKQDPFYFYVFHNELAVELGEVGRVEEANAALSIALASPFASAYPEWTETRNELEAKRTSATRSIIAVQRLPEPARSVEPQKRRNHQRSIHRNVEPRLRWLVRAAKSRTKETTHPAVIGTVAIHSAARFILDRVADCIQSRAPPSR